MHPHPHDRRYGLPRSASWILLVGAACLVAAAVSSDAGGGLVQIVLDRDLTASERIDAVQAVLEGWGPLAPLAYVAFVCVEVIVAPLPGAILYAPGGLVFGGFWGGLLALLGNVLGAGISCSLMRRLGRSRLEWMWDTERFQALDQRLAAAGVWVIALLRLNPLTSSDLVSYAAGLTAIPTWKVMLGTLLGMAPLCWAQAYLSEEILTAFPGLIHVLWIACLVYIGLAAWAFRRLAVRSRAAETVED